MLKPAARESGRTAARRRRQGSRTREAEGARGQKAAATPPPIGATRFEAVMKAAERSGLLSRKSGRISGRVSPKLVRQAKKQTGIAGDSDLIVFALASVALEDNFSQVFRKSRGKVPADLKLGF